MPGINLVIQLYPQMLSFDTLYFLHGDNHQGKGESEITTFG